jgi:hypothetical protein
MLIVQFSDKYSSTDFWLCPTVSLCIKIFILYRKYPHSHTEVHTCVSLNLHFSLIIFRNARWSFSKLPPQTYGSLVFYQNICSFHEILLLRCHNLLKLLSLKFLFLKFCEHRLKKIDSEDT